ncbi:MAG: nuclear transport factor 2 family protein [Chitinophagaceae bacterium]
MNSNNGEETAIRKALEDYYFKGIYEGDTDLLRKVYAKKDILVFGDVDGQPYFKTIEQYLDGVKNRKSPKEQGSTFKPEIISIRQVNTIAVAELQVKMYQFDYHEFLSFHKLDGSWVIVNKMLTDEKK